MDRLLILVLLLGLLFAIYWFQNKMSEQNNSQNNNSQNNSKEKEKEKANQLEYYESSEDDKHTFNLDMLTNNSNNTFASVASLASLETVASRESAGTYNSSNMELIDEEDDSLISDNDESFNMTDKSANSFSLADLTDSKPQDSI